MAVIYTPHYAQFFGTGGLPLAGGKLYTYAAGTSTPKATYTTAAATVENANPIILDASGRATLFIDGSYKYVLNDADDNHIETTDNITAFSAVSESTEGFFQSFSGDGAETEFTLSEDFGTDENALIVFAQREYSTNGAFATDTGWTEGADWTIGSGVATATASSAALEQTSAVSVVQGVAYQFSYTITRSAGSVTPSLGGVNGTARSASGTYSDIIVAGATQVIAFTGSSFSGTVDNVSVVKVGDFSPVNPSDYTLNGTSLTFNIPPTTGPGNIFVYAPYTLINAGGAAQTAADAAIAAQAAAEAAQTAAEAAETGAEAAEASVLGLNATSTSSLAIGTGGKSFTTQSGKGFISGMWILATSDADPTNYMHGYVSSYSSTTLVMVATNTGGSGTHADWTIRVSGTRGAIGPAGSISDFSGVTGATITASDIIIFSDVDDSNASRTDTVQGILDLVTTPSVDGINNGGYADNRYYRGIGEVSANSAFAANKLWAVPFAIGETTTFTRIGAQVASIPAAGAARLGIYNMAGGVPTSLVLDAGTIDVSTTGEKEITISQTLDAGFYCLALVGNATPTLIKIENTADADFGSFIMGGASGSGFIDGFSVSHTYGALPDPFGTPALEASGVPLLWLRKV